MMDSSPTPPLTSGAKPTWTPNQEVGADFLGETIDGRYQIVRRLAKGGMAHVFLAKDRTRKCHVAVKILHNQQARRRFELEAQVLSNVQCEYIVRAIAFGETADGQPYLALEYLEGETLGQRLARGPLPWREVARLGAQIATGLHVLHTAGIVHRDVKPDNIVIALGADRSVAKVIDLGLASVGAPFHDAQAARFASQVAPRHKTQLGRVLGTPEYLPPEAGTCDAAPTLDVYALGTTLYQLCTRLLPRMTGGRSIHEVVPGSDAPEELSRLIRAAIEPDAGDRLPSADHLRRGLEAILDAYPATPRPRRLFGGSYDRLEVLGVGASAIVYRASDRWLSREVALKVLRAAEPDADDVIRFRRAAKVLSALHHPSIPRILHFGQDGEQHFAVTELCSGVPATDFMRQDRHLRPDEVIAVGRQLAGALEATHAVGVVYRDLHAGNVLIARGETPKAWIFDFDHGQVSLEFYARLTERWATPPEERAQPKREKPLQNTDYAAPEVKAGAAFTEASDVFALGLLLYRLLTGARPFPPWGGETIPPRMVCPACPPELERLLLSMLSPAPGARPTLATLGTAFDDAQADLEEQDEECDEPDIPGPAALASNVVREASVDGASDGAEARSIDVSGGASAVAPTALVAPEPELRRDGISATAPAAPTALEPVEPTSTAATSAGTESAAPTPEAVEPRSIAVPARARRMAWLALAIAGAVMLLLFVPREQSPLEEPSGDQPVASQAPREFADDLHRQASPTSADEGLPPSLTGQDGTQTRLGSHETAPGPHEPAQTWEERMHDAEASARQCLDAAGVEPRRVVVTFAPGESPGFANIAADSPHALCIRKALDLLSIDSDVRLRHTFFDAP